MKRFLPALAPSFCRSVVMIVAAVASTTASPGAAVAADAGFVLHVQSVVVPCGDGPDDASMTCAAVAAVGNTSHLQALWVFAFGWEALPGWPQGHGIGGAQLGIAYDPTVSVLGWVLCTGGSHLPQDSPLLGTWPESHTAISVTWGGGEYHQPSGFARIGFFVLEPGSEGWVGIAPDLRLAPPSALIMSGGVSPVEIPVPPGGFSSADAGGTNPENALVSCMDGVPLREASWGRVKQGFR